MRALAEVRLREARTLAAAAAAVLAERQRLCSYSSVCGLKLLGYEAERQQL